MSKRRPVVGCSAAGANGRNEVGCVVLLKAAVGTSAGSRRSDVESSIVTMHRYSALSNRPIVWAPAADGQTDRQTYEPTNTLANRRRIEALGNLCQSDIIVTQTGCRISNKFHSRFLPSTMNQNSHCV